MHLEEHEYAWTWNGYNPVFVGYEACPPNQKFGPGIMETYTVHFVLSGTGVFCTKGKEYQITPGQMFSFAPFETVWYKADEKDPWSFIWINFVITGNATFRFEQAVIDAPFLQPIFEAIRNYPDHATTGRDFVANCLQEIAAQLFSKQHHNSYLVDKAVQYIQHNYSNENLSISDLACKLGISRYTLSDAFMKTKGIAPLEYLIRYRLEKACEYMTHQRLPLNIAAYSVGYKNYDQFGKIFKKYYGMSPRTYQQQQLEAKNR